MYGYNLVDNGQGTLFSDSWTIVGGAVNTYSASSVLEPEDYEPSIMKQYLDFLRRDIEENPSKLVEPDQAQEQELDELLAGV